MRGRRGILLAAGVVTIVAALAAARLLLFAPSRLGPGSDPNETGLNDARVGERLNVFLSGFEPKGDDPVRVRAIRVTDLPRGLRLVGIHALFDGPTAGTRVGDLQQRFPGEFDFRPVTDMVFEAGRPERWSIVVVVEATEVGEWRTSGIEVDWSAGWYRGSTRYPYRIGMNVVHPA